jgi:anti-sigma factor RsiW
MNSSENEILISAYLDDELTVEERARVEQLLAGSAEARQLLEELRALRGGLQELPQHRLELDFAQKVLNKIEQTPPSYIEQPPATSETVVSKRNVAASAAQTPALESPTKFRLPFNRRGLGWSLIAIAAAVMLMVANRSNQNVQLPRPAERDHANAPTGGMQNHVAMDRAKNEPLSISAPSMAEKEGASGEAVVRSADSAPPAGALASDKDLRPAAPPITRDEGQASPPKTSLAIDKPAIGFEKSKAESLSESPASSSETGGKLAIQEQPSVVQLRRQESAAPGMGGPPSATTNPDQPSAQGESDSVLVVRADISGDAARGRAFDQVLAKNAIELADEKQDAQASVEQKTFAGKKQSAATADASGVDVVYVEAAPAQIEQTLADLRKAPQQFPAVSVANMKQSELNTDGSVYALPGQANQRGLNSDTAANDSSRSNVQSKTDSFAQLGQRTLRNSQQLGWASRILNQNQANSQLAPMTPSNQLQASDNKADESGAVSGAELGGAAAVAQDQKNAPRAALNPNARGYENRSQMNSQAAPQAESFAAGGAAAANNRSDMQNSQNQSNAITQQRALFILRVVDDQSPSGPETAMPAARPAFRAPGAAPQPSEQPTQK